MRTQHDGHEYHIKFRHNREQRLTTCLLETPGQYYPEAEAVVELNGRTPLLWVVVGSKAYGYAHVHPADQYCKAAGRRVALKRAIQHLPRAARAAIWAAYHARADNDRT